MVAQMGYTIETVTTSEVQKITIDNDAANNITLSKNELPLHDI
jgi:hypothetical protein